jgi:hypothetical protein
VRLYVFVEVWPLHTTLHAPSPVEVLGGGFGSLVAPLFTFCLAVFALVLGMAVIRLLVVQEARSVGKVKTYWSIAAGLACGVWWLLASFGRQYCAAGYLADAVSWSGLGVLGGYVTANHEF